MHTVKCNHKPGMVGIISADLSRYPDWMKSMLRLMMPHGSRWSWCHGNGFAIHRNAIANQLHQEADDGSVWDGDWVWFTDDDQPFDPDQLLKLLDRNVDIIQPLVVTRKAPYLPYAYEYDENSPSKYVQFDWPQLNESGIQEVDACGAGGLLVRRRVFEAMEFPFFEEGRTAAECIGEDMWFCSKAKALGFKVYIDLDNVSGHLGTYQVWPRFVDGEWGTILGLSQTVKPWIPWHKFRDLKGEELANGAHLHGSADVDHAVHD